MQDFTPAVGVGILFIAGEGRGIIWSKMSSILTGSADTSNSGCFLLDRSCCPPFPALLDGTKHCTLYQGSLVEALSS